MFEPISELAEINPPLSVSAPIHSGDFISFIPMSDVSESGQWLTYRTRAFSQVKSGFTPFQEGDVLFAKITPCMENGKGAQAVGLEKGIGYGSTEFHILRAKVDNSPRYIFHLSQSSNLRLKAEASMIGSAGQKRVPSEFFRKHRVFAPIPAEQRLIARILDTLDTQIEKTEALIAKLEKVKEGLLHDLLTRGIDENGQLRPSSEQAPELYKESPLGLIPRIWGTPLLDEISIRGSGHTPSRSNPAFWNGGVSWVSLSDSKSLDNVWIDNTAKEISMLGVANSSAVIHPAGTVVLSRDAGIGKSSVIRDQMAVSQHFMAWRCGSSLDNLFLYYWLQWMKPRFEAIALGSTIQTIGLRYFESLRIPLPPISEQKKISSILLSINERIWREQGAKNKAISKKGGLMDDLLTGRIRVTTLLEQQKEATSA